MTQALPVSIGTPQNPHNPARRRSAQVVGRVGDKDSVPSRLLTNGTWREGIRGDGEVIEVGWGLVAGGVAR